MKIIGTNERNGYSSTECRNIKIVSSGTYLPDEIVKSDHLFEEIRSYEQYNIPTNWLSDKVGIYERRVGKPNAVPSDHAVPAAEMALANLPPSVVDEIGVVIFCGIERDQSEPATAHVIQEELGLHAHRAFDVSNACFGFVEAITIIGTYISAGLTRYGMVVTGEVSTHVMAAAIENLKGGMEIKAARNIIGALTVGDAGGAVVVGLSEDADDARFEVVNRYTDSTHINKCIYTRDENGVVQGQMLMGQISNQIIKKHEMLIDASMEHLGWSGIDWVVSHQMGKPPFEKIRKLTQVDDSAMVKTYPYLGNITSATFPVNYEKLADNGKVQAGDRIFGCFAGSGLAIGQFGYRF